MALADLQQQAESQADPEGQAALTDVQRARVFAQPLLEGRALDTGEDAWGHAVGVSTILAGLGAAQSLQAAAYLVYAADFIQKPDEVIARAFGASHGAMVAHTRKLVQIQRAARTAQVGEDERAQQTERVRKMLLAFSRDLRVVLLRLASRLQTLRWYAGAKRPCPQALARESLEVFAPLANRLGIWQIKWELEDFAFRFLYPEQYHTVARLLDERRVEREAGVQALAELLRGLLRDLPVQAEVQGRPKHLYSIWRKMQGKQLEFTQVMDVRAMRVIVQDVPQCYAALARVHERFTPIDGEFDDYIAKPKPNGYQSLHTVVRDASGRAVEIQIRTRAMHEYAEFGVAAHWAYKEAGRQGYVGVSAAGGFEDRVAQARKAVLQQLLAWEREAVDQASPGFEDRIYVFTPQAAIVDLPTGGTAVDFAYALHTNLGHRCRGARVDGAMVPLNTPLQTGQTVEVISVKEGGPSMDWLNPELRYLASARSRAKVRAWFNALEQAQTIARGREAVERLLQREGRTALKLDELATQLGFKAANELFEVVGKDEYSLRNIEQLLRPVAPDKADDEGLVLKRSKAEGAGSGVLVVGVDSLLTHLARCCRPAPPDAIAGFVTRGRGVAI
ncbi:MAG: RelA/SpoT family protein, partial [Betaproteobacteria bacterium]